MAIFWDDMYSVGITQIDNQHKVLIHLINKLEELHYHNDKFDNFDGVLLGIMRELKNYTVLHFATEEVLMQMFDYPDFDKHKEGHDSFVRLVNDQYKSLKELLLRKHNTKDEHDKKDIETEIRKRIEKVLEFLQDWLVAHIQHSDQEYTEFFLKIQKKARSMGGWFSFLK